MIYSVTGPPKGMETWVTSNHQFLADTFPILYKTEGRNSSRLITYTF